jgi:hypothetical protein
MCIICGRKGINYGACHNMGDGILGPQGEYVCKPAVKEGGGGTSFTSGRSGGKRQGSTTKSGSSFSEPAPDVKSRCYVRLQSLAIDVKSELLRVRKAQMDRNLDLSFALREYMESGPPTEFMEQRKSFHNVPHDRFGKRKPAVSSVPSSAHSLSLGHSLSEPVPAVKFDFKTPPASRATLERGSPGRRRQNQSWMPPEGGWVDVKPTKKAVDSKGTRPPSGYMEMPMGQRCLNE